MSNTIGAIGLAELTIAFLAVAAALWLFRALHDRLTGPSAARLESGSEFHIQVLVAMYGLLLGFVTVALWQKQDDAERNTVDESNQVRLLSRTALVVGGDQQATMDALLDYVQAVVYKEWPMMLDREQEEMFAASPELDAVWAQIVSARPETPAQLAIYQEVVNHYETLSQDRQRRLLDSERALPDLLRFTLLAGGCFIVLAILLMRTEGERASQQVLSAVTGGYLMLLIYLVFVLENPFLGMWRVTPEPYIKVLTSLH